MMRIASQTRGWDRVQQTAGSESGMMHSLLSERET